MFRRTEASMVPSSAWYSTDVLKPTGAGLPRADLTLTCGAMLSVPHLIQAQGQANCDMADMIWALTPLLSPHIVLLAKQIWECWRDDPAVRAGPA